MKKIQYIIFVIAVASLCTLMWNCDRKSKLTVDFPERFEGKTVEMIDYMDSTIVSDAIVTNGKAIFEIVQSDSISLPNIMQLMVDGRAYAYYIAEEGNAYVSDSTNVATGTNLNDKFATLIARLDSIEDLDDMPKYISFVEEQYNSNLDNVLSGYFGVEWLKYADPSRVDSMLSKSDTQFRNSKRVRYYEDFAKKRLSTSPGHKYIDFEGENADGKKIKFSSLTKSGKYTVVDFWASWCPYCIKEIPALKQLRADLGDKLEIVGVAVRDLPADTKTMVDKHEIQWPVLYNTQKVPYDLYGFTGIPHLMLIAPDGTIVSRGENPDQIRARIADMAQTANI